MIFICKWCFESFDISFWVQWSKSRQSILLPFYTCVPYKTQFSPPSFPYPRAASATTPPPPRRHRPLPPVSFSPLASSFLSAGGGSPIKDRAHGRVSSPPLGCASVVSLRASSPARSADPHPALKVLAVMRHNAETTRRPVVRMVDERRLPWSPCVKDEMILFTIYYIYTWVLKEATTFAERV
jgi:hypothetical protein